MWGFIGTCHRRAQRTITSCCGTGTARWRASTTRSTSRPASRPDAKQARRRRSLTVRAPRPLKKGLCARPAGVRCRQEGHGTQAPHPRRYARPAVERDRSPCRRAGSRWRPPSAADGASSVSLHRMHLRGCRISGAEDGEGHCRHRVLDIADRQAPRCPPLRRLAQAMDRRAREIVVEANREWDRAALVIVLSPANMGLYRE